MPCEKGLQAPSKHGERGVDDVGGSAFAGEFQQIPGTRVSRPVLCTSQTTHRTSAHQSTTRPKLAPLRRAHFKASLLRYLFPHTRQRARAKLADFRFDTLPAFRRDAQLRIYRYLQLRQLKKQKQKQKRRSVGILSLLGRRGRAFWSGRLGRDVAVVKPKMTSGGTWGSNSSRYDGDGGSAWHEPREPGYRRKKIAGYLKAANELRQTYQQSYMDSWGKKDAQDDMPGTFPDAVVMRSGEEQMVLFPSYARYHVKRTPGTSLGTVTPESDREREVQNSSGAGNAEFWQAQWDTFEDDNAVVDVDVRGWLHAPNKSLNRKSRMFVALARSLCGIPAPSSSPTASATTSRQSSPHGLRRKMEEKAAEHDEEAVAQQANFIEDRYQKESGAAQQGQYSETPAGRSENAGVQKHSSHGATDLLSAHRNREDDPPVTSVQKRASWNDVASMTPDQMNHAHQNLMTRLAPFLANPVGSSPISAFFYNEELSRQKTVETDAFGHFNIRAALDFVPTHVRILASETLSATEEVHITEAKGISVISDIDDTIKHSAISSGAREIARNVFIRELGDLGIDGVKEWYQHLSKMGVKFHYVSNSPWQLYPTLMNFFSKAGLPSGSFHLKQYSGMFQGIFEPVAERKKGTLERIMRDFPERRFILIGDSGEADLEVYTDVVLENPGRILGIYIRDITTPMKKGFFDSSMGSWHGAGGIAPGRSNGTSRSTSRSRNRSAANSEDEDPDLKAAIANSLKDVTVGRGGDSPQDRPSLPARPATQTQQASHEENLIDLDYDPETHSSPAPLQRTTSNPPPSRPAKPAALTRMSSRETATSPTSPTSENKAPPTRPAKPSNLSSSTTPDTIESPESQQSSLPKKQPPAPPPKRQTYGSAAREKLHDAYNALPSASAYWHGNDQGSQDTNRGRETPPPKPSRTNTSSSMASTMSKNSEGAPPIPPRKPVGTASSRPLANSYVHQLDDNTTSTLYHPTAASSGASNPYNKKEELWRRRWARAKGILDEKGVVLRSWRIGEDVRNDVVQLVEKAQKGQR